MTAHKSKSFRSTEEALLQKECNRCAECLKIFGIKHAAISGASDEN